MCSRLSLSGFGGYLWPPFGCLFVVPVHLWFAGPRTRGEGEAPSCPSRALVATFGLHLAAFLWSLFTSGSRAREPEVKARLPVVPLGLW